MDKKPLIKLKFFKRIQRKSHLAPDANTSKVDQKYCFVKLYNQTLKWINKGSPCCRHKVYHILYNDS